jgi:hypothetical protein
MRTTDRGAREDEDLPAAVVRRDAPLVLDLLNDLPGQVARRRLPPCRSPKSTLSGVSLRFVCIII